MGFKKLYLIVIVGCMMGSCAPDADGPAPDKVFVKYFGEQGIQKAVDMVRTSTGDFIILGSQNLANDTTGTNFYLVRTDPSGNEIGTAVFDHEGEEDIPAAIKYISDAEYLIIGTSGSGAQQRLVYGRIRPSDQDDRDSIFVLEDQQFHELSGADVTGNPTGIEGVDIIQVAGEGGDMEYIILGNATRAGGTDILISRRTAANERVWITDKYLGTVSNERARAVFAQPDGKLLIIGSTTQPEAGFTGTNVVVYATSQFGTEENTLITGVSGADVNAEDIPYDVIQKSSDRYIIVGATSVDGTTTSFQMEVSHTGHLERQYVMETRFVENANQAYAVTKTLSNEFIVVGKFLDFTFNDEAKSGEMMVMRTTQFGEHMPDYDQHYGLVSGNDEANAVITASDGDVVVAATVEFGGSFQLIGLLKLNKFGELKD